MSSWAPIRGRGRATWPPPPARARPTATSAGIDDTTVERLAAAVLDQVEAKRSTWSRWNIVAASCRTMAAAGLQFGTVGKAAMDRSVLLNPAPAPDSMAVTDMTTGRSIYEPPEIFTSPEVLAAEDALLHAADDTTRARRARRDC